MSRGALITLVLVALMGTGLAINVVHEVQNPKGFLDFPIEDIQYFDYIDLDGAARSRCSVVSSGWGEEGNEVHAFMFADGNFRKITEFVGDSYVKSVYPLHLRYFVKTNRYEIVDGLRIIIELKPPISQTRVEVSHPPVPIPPIPAFRGNVL